MPSTYSPLLRAELQGSGENDTSWGDKTNNNFLNVFEQAIAGLAVISMVDANYTLSVNSGAADEARCAILVLQGTLTAQRDVIVPASSKTYTVKNACNQDVSIRTSGGSGSIIKAGTTSIVYCNGTNVESASSPTSDGSITPAKIDTTNTNAWRFGGALGIGRAQSYVAGYGTIGVDGTTGSRTTYYVGGAPKGELNGTINGLDISSAPGGLLSLSTNSVSRMSISNAGDIAMEKALTVGAGVFSTTGSFTSSVTVGGTISATGGYSGITAANVKTALTYTPTQNGTGPNQSSSLNVKIGASSTQPGKLRAAIESTDLGNVMFEGTTGVFIPASNANGKFDLATTVVGMGYDSLIQFREANHGTAQGNNFAAAPGFAFHWGAVAASQVRMQANGVISFLDNPGTGQQHIIANTGFFTGDVIAFYSDMRLKRKVSDIVGARAIIRKLNGFRYTENHLARSAGYNNRRVQLGLSAQEVKEVLPELIDLAPFDSEPVPGSAGEYVSKSGQNYMTVNYQRMVPVLVEAMKEQDDLIVKLEEKVLRYQTSLTEVMNRLSKLEAK